MAVKKASSSRRCGTGNKATETKAVAYKAKRDDVYECTVCGLAVTINETCGCVDVCDIACCGKPMKPKKAKAVKK